VYSAYGQVTIADASGSEISNLAIANRYTYTGREGDEGLSLYHYQARMYDAAGGRIASRDSIGYVDGPDAYGMYFLLIGVDPFGYGWIGAFVGGIGGTVGGVIGGGVTGAKAPESE